MNFVANKASIVGAASGLLNSLNFSSSGTFSAPSLAGYSPVPSMQTVALEHGNAIAASPGNSIKVSNALLRELEWAATNLRSLATVISTHEDNVATNFSKINPETGAKQLTIGTETVAGTFMRRPPFNPGFLTFAPAAITTEASQDAATLLKMFAATNDAAIGTAIAYWTTYAADMTAIAGEIAGTVSQLLASNNGEVFNAAAASLTGMAGKATNIAASAGIMSSHLQVLPAVKAMAINALTSIEAQSSAMKDPALKEAFERAEITAFLNGPYISQLQAAVPKIPNLTAPDVGGGIGSIAQAGASVSGLGGTAQVGLSPQGISGSMQAGTTPAATQATSPQTPTAMSPGNGHTTPAAGTSASTPQIPGSTTPSVPSTGPAPTTTGSTPQGISAMTAPNTGSSSPTRTSAAGTVSPSRMSGRSANSPHAAHSTSGQHSPRALSTGLRATPGPAANGRVSSGVPGSGAKSTAGPVAATRIPTGANGQKPSALAAGAAAPPSQSGAAANSASGLRTSSTKPGSLQSSFAAAIRQSAMQHSGNHAVTGATAGSGRREANVRAISNNASFFEQDEYQRELFGDEPATVPAVIGSQVRG